MAERHTYRNRFGTMLRVTADLTSPGLGWCIAARLSYGRVWRPVASLGLFATAADAERKLCALAHGNGWCDVGVAVPEVTRWEEAPADE